MRLADKKVAIVGGGLTGLSAAYGLTKRGIRTEVFEHSDKLGGLANGFKDKDWNWSLERYYHHVFTNDRAIISLAKEIGARLMMLKPVTSSFIRGEETQLDSPFSVINFKFLPFVQRIRMGFGLLVLKLIPDGGGLERFTVTKFLPNLIGRKAYEVIWEKLLKAKFGPYLDKVNMAWFWSRVAKRTKDLGYFEGGFETLIERLARKIEENGGRIVVNSEINEIKRSGTGWKIDGEYFDSVLMTVSAPVLDDYFDKKMVHFPQIEYLWSQTLVLELESSLMKSYWLNVLEDGWPFLVAVEHTRMLDKKNYGGNNIVYLGNYLPKGDERLKMTKEQLLKLYLPYIKKINSDFETKWVKKMWMFMSDFAQPVFPVNYSKVIPKHRTKLHGLYVANMSMVYPFDRGTNYAVEMGERVAEEIANELEYRDG